MAMVILSYSRGEQARFAELAEIYWACRGAYRDISAETQGLPIPGSRGDRDLSALLSRQPRIADSYERLITWAVQLYLYAASEHVGGLSALYRSTEVLISPLVLARAAIENSAHVIWILGSASDGAEDRLARAFLEATFGGEQAKMQAGRLRGKVDEEHKARTESYRQIKKDAAATFEAPHQDKDGRPLLRGHQLPSPEQIVMDMNRLVSQPLSDDLMQGTYGFLSNFVHPTFYAIHELFDVTEENGERVPALNRDITFPRATRQARRFALLPRSRLCSELLRLGVSALRGSQRRHHPAAARNLRGRPQSGAVRRIAAKRTDERLNLTGPGFGDPAA